MIVGKSYSISQYLKIIIRIVVCHGVLCSIIQFGYNSISEPLKCRSILANNVMNRCLCACVCCEMSVCYSAGFYIRFHLGVAAIEAFVQRFAGPVA